MKTQDPREQLSGLQEEQLFSLARNEAAQWIYRKVAAGLLKEKASLKANHPEIAHVLAAFVAEVAPVEHESEVVPVVEEAVSEPKIDPIPPVFKASVTTESLNAPEVIENGQK